MAVFGQIEKGQTPEKIAENDYLMKCERRQWRYLQQAQCE